MLCRAPTSAQTCAGLQTGWTGQALAYDNEGRLTHWASFQNQAGTPSADDFLYDGAGQRVEQRSTPSGQSTTTTNYVLGGLEEDTSGTLTKYLGVAGLPSAVRVGASGALAYLASDALGSVSEALDGAGSVTAAQLYAPYGGLRYSSGTMPTAKGFTGQRADTATGLDYYGARYYDPVASQFISADTVANGLSPYAYVRGDPETLTDPSGRRYECPEGGCGGGGGSGGGGSGGGGSGGGGSGSGSGGGGHGRCDPSNPGQCAPPPGGGGSGNGSGVGNCDAYCHSQRNQDNEKTKNSQVKSLRDLGYLFLKIGATVGTIADILELLSGDFLGGLKALVVVLGAAIDLITIWVGNSSGNVASLFDGIAEAMSVFLGVVDAVIAAASFGMWLGVALRVGLAAFTGGLPLLLGLAGSAGLAAVGYGLTVIGENDLIDANYQDQMNVKDWCAQYGTNACEPA